MTDAKLEAALEAVEAVERGKYLVKFLEPLNSYLEKAVGQLGEIRAELGKMDRTDVAKEIYVRILSARLNFTADAAQAAATAEAAFFYADAFIKRMEKR